MPRDLTTRRYRRVLIASVLTLVTSAVFLGLIGLLQWRGRQAVDVDTHTLVAQTSQQLLRALQSRRGTLTFLRDTLRRRPTLAHVQLEAMGASAIDHTRHLLAAGSIQIESSPAWWSVRGLAEAELTQVNRAIVQRMQLRGAWRVPSTFVLLTNAQRPLLVMLEPFRPAAFPANAVIGVFDTQPLLEDFFTSTLAPHNPVQVLNDVGLLYRSANWHPAMEGQRFLVVEQPLSVDAARWIIRMQPASTHVAQTLSWLNVWLIVLSGLTGIGIIIIVWLLAARTWVLQRAVDRRTAALRQALRRVRQLAITDELTGLYNRRFFLRRWEWECERAKRYARPLACLMIDVNGFKDVNDHLGHAAGDRVLQQVARQLRAMLRQPDILARFGGDEFIIALPETTPDQTALVAEKLRQLSIPLPDPYTHGVAPVSLSVGMSQVEAQAETPQAVLDAADQSLYADKRRLKTHAYP